MVQPQEPQIQINPDSGHVIHNFVNFVPIKFRFVTECIKKLLKYLVKLEYPSQYYKAVQEYLEIAQIARKRGTIRQTIVLRLK